MYNALVCLAASWLSDSSVDTGRLRFLTAGLAPLSQPDFRCTSWHNKKT